MTSSDADVVAAGAGRDGLFCAATLAKPGRNRHLYCFRHLDVDPVQLWRHCLDRRRQCFS